ncbi:uncharacterized protein LOC129570850 [Sitodiplosis mosellana]|uniref:uncharacterized protein LOC129570850 n=1 Tax=Sitodiplosis mosellana TaxID=263140 RepID=UPI002444659F|nr:uncharacterized protein LOC129570850 [Sitodiplosis mosellana]
MDLSGRCQLVVIRINKQQNNQMLLQSQQDNQRLQHRISYLEDQVRDMINQNSRRTNQKIMKRDHVTSINISSSPQDNEGAQVFQRGNFIATIIGGKAIQTTHSVSSNGSATYRPQRNTLQHSHSQQYIGANSKIIETSLKSSQNLKDKHVRDHRKENHRSQPDLFYDEEKLRSGHQRYKKDLQDLRNARSLEFDSEEPKQNNVMIPKHPSVRREIDYTSEPVATPLSNSGSRTRNGRPTPPKKPLRLSLQGIQRTQSLQTIEANATATILDLEKKRSLKRTHRGNKTPDNDGETNSLFIASLGRNKYIEKTPNSHIN